MANMACSFENQNNEGSIVNEVPEINEPSLAALTNTSNSSTDKDFKLIELKRELYHLREADNRLSDFEARPSESVHVQQIEDWSSGNERSLAAEVSARSIFDLQKNKDSSGKSVAPPQISTTISSINHTTENKFENCVLPSVPDSAFLQQNSQLSKQKRSKVGLFDFRERAVQEKARVRHIRRLRRRGYEVTSQSETINSRFISNPYEGAVDDHAIIKIKSKAALDSSKQTQPNSISAPKVTFSPPADEETLAKIEIAFSEWKLRKKLLAENGLVSTRKRSSSHSPPRSTPEVCLLRKLLSNSCSSSVEFLNHSGNIRRQRKPAGKTCGTIGSPIPSFSLRSNGKKLPNSIKSTSTSASGVTVTSTDLPTKERFEGKSSSPAHSRLPGINQHRRFVLKNKHLNKIQSGENIFSSSLPNLNYNSSDDMATNSHRPRSSSLKKVRASTPGKSPKPRRRQNLGTDNDQTSGPKRGSNKTSEHVESKLPLQRRVTLNTCLPTGSPTFQRAMKTMHVPNSEYSEIFGQKRRDSIIQKYTLAESALNSFRDDNDLTKIESSSNALDQVTVRFQEDFKLLKGGLNEGKTQTKYKSILKKRRQSVDDLEISTRKNLSKYLESKLGGTSK